MPVQLQVPFCRPQVSEDEIAAVVQVLRSGNLSLGHKVLEFETALAHAAGIRHAVALSNGTAALHLALLAAGIGPGDEVITSAFTYIATANAVINAGATPVFVDIEPDSCNLDPSKLAGALTPRTKAILPVHVFGRPCRMDAIMAFALEHKLTVIEDACEAFGSSFRGQPVGGFGVAGAIGFAPNKQITTGEGGALLTHDEGVANFVRSMRRQGRSEDGRSFVHVGFNYRMTDIQAAIGALQAQRLQSKIEARAAAADLYRHTLRDLPDVVPPAPAGPDAQISWFAFVVMLDRNLAGPRRDQIVKRMNQRGIGAATYFDALHLQPSIRDRVRLQPGGLPVTEDVALRSIALPFFAGLTQDEASSVRSVLQEELRAARNA